MAGADKEYEAKCSACRTSRSATCRRNRSSIPDKTVRQEVESAMGEVMEAQAKLEEVYAAYAEEDADFDKLAEEQARLEAIIATAGSDTEHQMEIAADALRLPPWDANIGKLSGGEKRRVALCKLLLKGPTCCCSTNRPTTSTPNRWSGWSSSSCVSPGTVVAVTHDRYFLDNAAEWILELDRGHGIPWKGNYSSWLEQKEARLETRTSRSTPHEGDEAGTGMGAQNPKAARPRARRVSPATRKCRASNTRSATRRRKSSSRWPSAWATRSSSSTACQSPSATAC